MAESVNMLTLGINPTPAVEGGRVVNRSLDSIAQSAEKAANSLANIEGKFDILNAGFRKTDQTIEKTVQRIDSFTKQYNEAKKAMLNNTSSTDGIFTRMSEGYDGFTSKLATARAIVVEFYAFAKDVTELVEDKANFRALAASYGSNSELILSASRKATKGMVSDVELMAGASRALELGITDDYTKIARIWEISEAKADALKKSQIQVFGEITDSIGRGSAKQLLALGLLPESMKKAGDGTELLMKKTDLLKMTLDQGGTTIKRLGDNGLSSSDAVNKLGASCTNFFNDIKISFEPGVAVAVAGLQKLVQTAHWTFNALKTIKEGLPGGSIWGAEKDTDQIIEEQTADLSVIKNPILRNWKLAGRYSQMADFNSQMSPRVSDATRKKLEEENEILTNLSAQAKTEAVIDSAKFARKMFMSGGGLSIGYGTPGEIKVDESGYKAREELLKGQRDAVEAANQASEKYFKTLNLTADAEYKLQKGIADTNLELGKIKVGSDFAQKLALVPAASATAFAGLGKVLQALPPFLDNVDRAVVKIRLEPLSEATTKYFGSLLDGNQTLEEHGKLLDGFSGTMGTAIGAAGGLGNSFLAVNGALNSINFARAEKEIDAISKKVWTTADAFNAWAVAAGAAGMIGPAAKLIPTKDMDDITKKAREEDQNRVEKLSSKMRINVRDSFEQGLYDAMNGGNFFKSFGEALKQQVTSALAASLTDSIFKGGAGIFSLGGTQGNNGILSNLLGSGGIFGKGAGALGSAGTALIAGYGINKLFGSGGVFGSTQEKFQGQATSSVQGINDQVKQAMAARGAVGSMLGVSDATLAAMNDLQFANAAVISRTSGDGIFKKKTKTYDIDATAANASLEKFSALMAGAQAEAARREFEKSMESLRDPAKALAMTIEDLDKAIARVGSTSPEGMTLTTQLAQAQNQQRGELESRRASFFDFVVGNPYAAGVQGGDMLKFLAQSSGGKVQLPGMTETGTEFSLMQSAIQTQASSEYELGHGGSIDQKKEMLTNYLGALDDLIKNTSFRVNDTALTISERQQALSEFQTATQSYWSTKDQLYQIEQEGLAKSSPKQEDLIRDMETNKNSWLGFSAANPYFITSDADRSYLRSAISSGSATGATDVGALRNSVDIMSRNANAAFSFDSRQLLASGDSAQQLASLRDQAGIANSEAGFYGGIMEEARAQINTEGQSIEALSLAYDRFQTAQRAHFDARMRALRAEQDAISLTKQQEEETARLQKEEEARQKEKAQANFNNALGSLTTFIAGISKNKFGQTVIDSTGRFTSTDDLMQRIASGVYGEDQALMGNLTQAVAKATRSYGYGRN